LLAQVDYGNLPEFVVRPEETDGPQMLGGSYSIFDIALELAPEGMKTDFDLIYGLTEKAHLDAGYVMGIHMDNHHDEMSDDEIISLLNKISEKDDTQVLGCGYDALVHAEDNPLELSEGSVVFHQRYPNRAVQFIRRGTRLSILGGQHASKDRVLAVVNSHAGETLDANKAHKLSQPAYSHDQKPFEELLNALSNNAGKIDPEWGKNIREKGNELYMKWYGVVGNRLAGMTPVLE
jgi:hypothetical protein